MSRNTIIVLIYHHHKLLDLIYISIVIYIDKRPLEVMTVCFVKLLQ
jgi:hypothetical protein